MSAARVGEAGVTGAAGGALAGAAAHLVAGRFGFTVVAAAFGAANGLVAGAAAIYDWRRPKGWVAFALDSTWGLPGVVAGLGVHALSWLPPRRPGFVFALSRRANRFVYARGVAPRAGFAFTAGNVCTGAARDDVVDGRRSRLIERHEDLHVWQNRLFGPLYLVGYAAWMVSGAVVGLAVGLVRRDAPLFAYVETIAYYDNPFEYWAYRRDDYWPPRGALPAVAWRTRRSR